MSKKLDENKITNELKGASAFFQKSGQSADLPAGELHGKVPDQPGDQTIDQTTSQSVKQSTSESIEQSTMSTPDPTLDPTQVRGTLRANPRDTSRALPTRDEIQEFSFRQRDELKVKVQAEVPHYWQTELEEIARELDVKKLELYRFILGEFLGKIKRQKEPK